MTSVKRVFSDFYDSIEQRRLLDLVGEQLFIPSYRARLRFDWLIHKTVVVSDAQFFDGVFLSSLTHKSLAELLPRHWDDTASLEVRSRAGELEQTTVQFVQSQHGDPLRGFVFSSISEQEQRIATKQHLESHEPIDLGSVEDVISLLQQSGVERAELDRLQDNWRHGIEMFSHDSTAGIVQSKQWGPKHDLDSAFQSEPVERAETYLKSELGRGFLKELWAKRYDRSWVYQNCSDVRKKYSGENLPGDEYNDIVAIESWFHRGYNRANAIQHEALFDVMDDALFAISKASGRFDSMFNGDEVLAESSRVPIPMAFMEQLESMPIGLLEAVVNENKAHLTRWWEEGDANSLRVVIESLASRMDLSNDTTPLLRVARVPFKLLAGASKGDRVIGGFVLAAIGELAGQVGAGIPGIGTVTGGGLGALAVLGELVDREYSVENRIARRIVEFTKSRGGN